MQWLRVENFMGSASAIASSLYENDAHDIDDLNVLTNPEILFSGIIPRPLKY